MNPLPRGRVREPALSERSESMGQGEGMVVASQKNQVVR